jgi:hypothetical protein
VSDSHVAPTELEAVLLRHPETSMGNVDANEDEEPRAYIETITPPGLSSADIHQFMVDKVAPISIFRGLFQSSLIFHGTQ